MNLPRPHDETRVSSPAPDGATILQTDPDAARRLAAILLFMAAKARQDVKVFFEFVMVEEKTRQRLRTEAHQAVVLDFLRDNQRAVLMMPRGHSKTFLIAAYLLWLIGHDPSARCAIVSATQEQAQKVLRLVRDYIEDPAVSGGRLQMVFPHLRPTQKKHEPWTQTAITIDRPAGTRDPTLVAVGYEGAILGARLKYVFVDDILTQENTNTEEGRVKLIEWVDGSLMGTMDTRGDPRVVLSGTAWHPRDLLHVATEDKGWATLKMDVVGNVDVYTDVDPSNCPDHPDGWDHPGLRPSRLHPSHNRLVAHDPDPFEKKLLWPGAFREVAVDDVAGQQKALEALRRSKLPHVFQQMYMMVAHDYSSALCKPEWIEACMKLAREKGVHTLLDEYRGGGLVFTGVDLGINVGEHNDDTVLFTFLVLDSGHRQILDIDIGKYDGATKMRKVEEKVERYGSALVMVESNGGQKLLVEWCLDRNVSLPVRAQQTTAMKSHVELGIPGLFLEIYNGAWLIPNYIDDNGHRVVHPNVQRWCDAAVNYVPDKHTDDSLMAGYLGHQGARAWGITTGAQAVSQDIGVGDLLSR